jgi:hypothetical protein
MAKWVDIDFGKELKPSRSIRVRNTVKFIRIDPGCDISMGIEDSEICHTNHGLVRHPKTELEFVEHLGYVIPGPSYGHKSEVNPTLGYVALPFPHKADAVPIITQYCKGARFYSVLNDTRRSGESYLLANIGVRTIELKLTVKHF